MSLQMDDTVMASITNRLYNEITLILYEISHCYTNTKFLLYVMQYSYVIQTSSKAFQMNTLLFIQTSLHEYASTSTGIILKALYVNMLLSIQ